MSEEKYKSEWEELTVVQLKEELEGRGLSTAGRKSELVARLEESDLQMIQPQEGEQEGGQGGILEVEVKDDEKEETEFVVWAEDTDENLDEDKRMRCNVTNDGAEQEQSGDVEMHEENGADGSAKLAQSDQFHVDVSKDKDMFILTWHGQKISVPFREEVLKDLKHFGRHQNIIISPVELTDVYDDTIRPLIEMAVNVSMELDEIMPGMPIKGYLRLKFGSSAEAARATEIIKEYRPDGRELTIQQFGENDSEGHVLSKVKGKDTGAKDQLIQRLVYVSNIPSEVQEVDLKERFADALRVIVPKETTDGIGYAYLEYPTEAAATEAASNYKGTVIGDRILYVIKAMTERKEAYGLLKDNLRKYWLEQVRTLEALKAKPNSKKSPRELQDIETKLHKHKVRIDKDNRKREDLGLPVSENEVFSTEGLEPEKEEPKDKAKEPVARPENKIVEKKSNPTPPRRRFSPPSNRGNFNNRFSGRGGSFRGGSSNFARSSNIRSGPVGRPGPEARPNTNLMNQLQELVGALAHKLPNESSRFDYNDGGYNNRGYESRGGGGGVGSRGSFGGGYRGGDYGGSGGRFDGKRSGDGDFGGGDRKRRPGDDYPRYGSGRGEYSGSGGGSFGGSNRGRYNY